MEVRFIFAFLSTINFVNAACKSKNYTASTFPKFVENSNYGNNEDCEFNIKPEKTSHYYLEITMHNFGIKGRMPDCDGDYMEIFITR